ncbi:Uma2 family endonuclease [Limnofasciculus baicalensis]|uniref:Uma2 family endonuclease n=1 Tax=Limnofasciculus baicalensis BBK-W-15 TaxID=2699891 RepID=A0AAE3KPK6_9CYAN|nr:Uma2 family endonuclease [Limnofasciculus baicalensis]MCP2729748.1 Uma2 family endonuclease [Limnofasciculus baicalensis BBK-W-15]
MVQELRSPLEYATLPKSSISEAIIYPDSDGEPMSDNTKQFDAIVEIKLNLEWLFADNHNVFIAGDLLWYGVEGDNTICKAPDVMVVFGRPKGDRGSYKQWLEDNIAPQVVFEILSPGNTFKEMRQKFRFYEKHGVEEYYLYDPDDVELTGWQRVEAHLQEISPIQGWVSPRLGVRFELSTEKLEIYRPDGQKFTTFVELAQRAEQAETQLEMERRRSQAMAEQLRSLGINPEQL